jgi:hypothetical protein
VSLYAVLVGLLAPLWGLPTTVVSVWFICLLTISIPSVLFLRRLSASRVRPSLSDPPPPAHTTEPPLALETVSNDHVDATKDFVSPGSSGTLKSSK